MAALLLQIEDVTTRAERAGWALVVAATHGHDQVVRLLLDAGARARCCKDAQDARSPAAGSSIPLIAAAEHGELVCGGWLH